MSTQTVFFRDLGLMGYQAALDFQEALLQDNVKRKTWSRSQVKTVVGVPDYGLADQGPISRDAGRSENPEDDFTTRHFLLFVEHPPVYTLGKSGNIQNVLLSTMLW